MLYSSKVLDFWQAERSRLRVLEIWVSKIVSPFLETRLIYYTLHDQNVRHCDGFKNILANLAEIVPKSLCMSKELEPELFSLLSRN